jgi:hypothetical protein
MSADILSPRETRQYRSPLKAKAATGFDGVDFGFDSAEWVRQVAVHLGLGGTASHGERLLAVR